MVKFEITNMLPSPRHGANEFEIISFVENGIGSKLYDVIQKEKNQKFTMEVSPRKQNTKYTINSKLRKHSKDAIDFLVMLRYTFQTKTRNYFILTHTNKNTSLVSMLAYKNNLTEAEATFITAELVVGLEGLHKTGTVYGGISIDDIYLDSKGHVLLQRTYCGRTYWSRNECIQCNIKKCSNIYHTHKVPSEAEKAVDWLSLIQLFTVLLTEISSHVSKDFTRQVSNNNHTVCSIKSHALFSRINWDKINTKQTAVPIDFVQFVNGTLIKKQNNSFQSMSHMTNHLQVETSPSTIYRTRSKSEQSGRNYVEPNRPQIRRMNSCFQQIGNQTSERPPMRRFYSCVQNEGNYERRMRSGISYGNVQQEADCEQNNRTRSISSGAVQQHGSYEQNNWMRRADSCFQSEESYQQIDWTTRRAKSFCQQGNYEETNWSNRTNPYNHQDEIYRSVMQRSNTYSPISSSQVLVEGFRKRRPPFEESYIGNLDVQNTTNNLRAPQDHIRRKSENNADIREPTLKRIPRKSSLEHYRKRLEEISKVLDNNRNVIESIDMSNLEVRPSKNDTPTVHLPVKRNPEGSSNSIDKNKIADKLYSENDSIRLILSKYGLLKDDVISVDKHVTIENNSHNDDAFVKTLRNIKKENFIDDENSQTDSNEIVPVNQIKIEIIDSDVIELRDSIDDDDVFISDVNSRTMSRNEEKNAMESKNNEDDAMLPKQVEVASPDQIKTFTHSDVMLPNQVEAASPDQIKTFTHSDESRGTSHLLTKLQGLGTTKLKNYKSPPQILALDHLRQVKRHSSDVTTQSPRLLRLSQNQIERDQTTPVNLNRSTTAPQTDLCKLKPSLTDPVKYLFLQNPKPNLSKFPQSAMNSYDSGLHDINGQNNIDSQDDFHEKHQLQRTDSGVAMAETTSTIHVWKPGQPDPKFLQEEEMKIKVKESLCYDCGEKNHEKEQNNTNDGEFYYICKRCSKSRIERKEAIIELIQTEVNYGYDLRIIKEEFYIPMKQNSVCTQEELKKLFSNLQELLDVNSKLCSALQEGLESCVDQDDEDYVQLAVGEVFLDCVEFFEAYEVFCSKQKESLELLNVLKKKSELLRIFLAVSSKENNKLRKMDLKTFLTMPIQRIMKYPLLLNRIYKNTSPLCSDKQVLKLAFNKIESQIKIIDHISTKHNLSSASLKKNNSFTSQHNLNATDLSRLDKYVANLLDWKLDETSILLQEEFDVISESLLDLTVWDTIKQKRLVQIQASLCIHGTADNFKVTAKEACLKRDSNIVSDVKDAVVILLKKKSDEKCTLYQQPLNLKESVVSINQNIPMKFEILERDRTPFIFVAKNESVYKQWKTTIDFVMTSLKLKWRRRRGGMSNIMIPTML